MEENELTPEAKSAILKYLFKIFGPGSVALGVAGFFVGQAISNNAKMTAQEKLLQVYESAIEVRQQIREAESDLKESQNELEAALSKMRTDIDTSAEFLNTTSNRVGALSLTLVKSTESFDKFKLDLAQQLATDKSFQALISTNILSAPINDLISLNIVGSYPFVEEVVRSMDAYASEAKSNTQRTMNYLVYLSSVVDVLAEAAGLDPKLKDTAETMQKKIESKASDVIQLKVGELKI